MLHYIIQVVAFQLLFLVVYDLCLRKDTFFNLNRAYLLSTSLLSLVIPFIKIAGIKAVVAKDFVINLPEVFIGESLQTTTGIDPELAMATGINLETPSMSIWSIILISGMCVATLVLAYKIFTLVVLASKSPKRRRGKVLIVYLLNSTSAFSFFNYIFLGNQLSDKDSTSILEHEMVHINQKHSLDLLFFELLRIVFWFNPLVYLYQSRVATLHEYIADAKAVKGRNKADYYDNLLTQVFETQQFSFVNPFFKHSLIKKRILMLSKSKSKNILKLKYVLLVPLLFVMLVYTSCTNEEDVLVATEEDIEIIEVEETAEVPFSIIEETPTFTFCEDLKTNKERKQCMSDNIAKHVNKNFNTEIADSLGLVGRQRIHVIFKIDKEGRVKDVKSRAAHPALKKETERVIKTLPQFIPGKQKGKAVVVPYSLPILFQVQGDNTLQKRQELSQETTQKFKGQFKDADEVPFVALDEFPGANKCESFKSNEEKKLCFSLFISEFVNANFDTSLATKLDLVGKQRINVIFQIDKSGSIINVKSRAPHPDLEAEAKRVINSLPQFTPGKMNGKAVIVNYSLPILFQVQDAPKENKKN